MSPLLYVQISENITEQIKNGCLQENDKLSERKLAEQYQVSRVVVRDAIKLLNEKGLVTTRAGKGSFINIPSGEDLMDRFDQAVDNSSISSAVAMEAREIIERSFAPLIIQRATPENIAELHVVFNDMAEAIYDATLFATLDQLFHLKLSECTHNEVLQMFAGTLNSITNRNRLLSTLDMRKSAMEEHRGLVEAVENHDEAQFITHMERHLNCIRAYTNKTAHQSEVAV